MRGPTRLLLALTLLVGLGACGESTSGGPDEPSDSPATTIGTADWSLVQMAYGTASGGRVSGRLTALDSSAAVEQYAAQFRHAQLPGAIRRAVASTDLPTDRVLAAAVVMVGCDHPTEVTLSGPAGRVSIEAVPVPDPLPECFAPVTSVALVAIDPAFLGQAGSA